MAAMLEIETPSRIWRRIEAVEDRDMPSLPSLSLSDEDSVDAETAMQNDYDDQFEEDLESISSRIHSTPRSMHHTITSTTRHPSSTSSTARFAHSLASRSSKSSVALSNSSSRDMPTRRSQHDSFEVPSLPRIQPDNVTSHYQEDADEESKSSVPDVYLPPPDEEDDDLDRKSDLSMTNALESVSRTGSPPPISPEAMEHQETPKKNYDYSISLKSEPKVSTETLYSMKPKLMKSCRLLLSRNTAMLLFVEPIHVLAYLPFHPLARPPSRELHPLGHLRRRTHMKMLYMMNESPPSLLRVIQHLTFRPIGLRDKIQALFLLNRLHLLQRQPSLAHTPDSTSPLLQVTS